MELYAKTNIGVLLKKYPFLIDFLPTLSPTYKKLKNPLLRKTLGRTATLEMIAEMGDIDLDVLISEIKNEIREKEDNEANNSQNKKEQLKQIIRDLHDGVDKEALKERFAELIKDVSASEISEMEQNLIDEGMPESEIKRLCDVHVEVFKQSLEEQKKPEVEPGHPVHTFMLENRKTEKIIKQLNAVVEKIGEPTEDNIFDEQKKNFEDLVEQLSEINLHYLRKENQLFPLLEAHDVSGPTQVMWELHDDIRSLLKQVKTHLSENNVIDAIKSVRELIQMITDMIYKEEHILYPMSLETLSEQDWVKVKKGEEEIGYSWVHPGEGWAPEESVSDETMKDSGLLSLDTGTLTLDQVNLMLKHLPVDISFVDANDEVAYYSDTAERIFPRSAGVIGRKVQKCHPPKSVHIVKKIVSEFKAGTKDVAEFWIQLNGKFIHIRYFAVRDKQGKYRGTLEVSQDITDIKKLDGERRLLDWK